MSENTVTITISREAAQEIADMELYDGPDDPTYEAICACRAALKENQ